MKCTAYELQTLEHQLWELFEEEETEVRDAMWGHEYDSITEEHKNRAFAYAEAFEKIKSMKRKAAIEFLNKFIDEDIEIF